MKTLVVGIGNPIRGDDGVGPAVAEAVCRGGRLRDGGEWECLPFAGSGLDLLGAADGCGRVVLIDSVANGQIPEGDCCRVELPGAEAEMTRGVSAHYVGIADALRLACHLKIPLPMVRFYGVGVRPADGYREGLSTALARRVPAIAEGIVEDIRKDGTD